MRIVNKNFVFVSDFDGTISDTDFYKHIMKKYMPEKEFTSYRDWKAGKTLDIDFLAEIFQNIRLSEQALHKEILNLPIDPTLSSFIRYIHAMQGDFVVLSAGTSYYIELLFRHHNIDTITIYSNKGIFKDNGIYFDLDPTDQFYSKRYGIDKKKVVQYLKLRYPAVYYAGDSEPDYEASLICDIRFAKSTLKELFEQNHISYYAFNQFSEIQTIMQTLFLKS